MITCNRCGFTSPDGAFNCPRCGAPLANKMGSGLGPQKGGQEQPGLPAWLESLRVGERPAAPMDNPENFTAAELFEEGALPSWMRAERLDNVDLSRHGIPVVPGPSGSGAASQQGLNAQSLIDEKSLPSWMQDNNPSTPSLPSSGIAASSLVQPDSVPDWMKALQQQHASQLERPAVPPSSPPASPVQRPQAIEKGFSPRDLIDEKSLPSWMTQQGAQGTTPSVSMTPPSLSAQQPQAIEKGFSPRDLIDEKSLPSWMTQQENASSARPMSSEQPAQPGKISPSSLLDANSLPSWLREAGGLQQQAGMAPPAASPSSWSAPSWQAQQPPMQQPPMQQPPMQQPVQTPPPAPGNGLAASSFVDPSSLPEWLRAGANQAGGSFPSQAMNDPAMPGAYGGPPRVENVRVPNRPRNEVINPSQTGQLAANVFASMLGVAPAMPPASNGPAPTNAPYGQQGPMPPQGMAPMGMPNQAGMPMQGMPGGMPQGYNPGGSGIYPGSAQGNLGGSGIYPGSAQGNPPVTGPTNVRPISPINEQKNTKKRGLVESLLDWLRR